MQVLIPVAWLSQDPCRIPTPLVSGLIVVAGTGVADASAGDDAAVGVAAGLVVVAGVAVFEEVQPAVINAMQITASRIRNILEFFMDLCVVQISLKKL